MEYLIKVTNTYVVPTVEDALRLRERLSTEITCGELVSFSYTTKVTKDSEYQVCKATINFNTEKDPETHIEVNYNADI